MATFASSAINLTKTIVGAGLLAIPFAFKADGVALGLFLVAFAAVASAAGLNIVTRCSITHLFPRGKETSFFALCSITYPHLTFLFDFSIFIQCFGVALSYLVLVGDIVPSMIDNVLSRNQVILSSLVIIIPLISMRKLDSLKMGSLVGLLAILYLTLLVIAHALTDDLSQTQGPVKVWTTGTWPEIMSSFSIIVFAFTAAQNICTITNEIGDKTQLDNVVYTAIGASSVLFITVGISGYIQFGDDVSGNVILNYDPNLLSSKIGKFALVLMVILSFPLMIHPCRISFNNMIHSLEPQYKDATHEESQVLMPGAFTQDEEEQAVPLSTNRFIVLSVILIIAVYGLALSITSFELVLALVGATGSTLICFILPGLFGFKLFKSSKEQFWSLALSIWGTVVMVVSVYASLAY